MSSKAAATDAVREVRKRAGIAPTQRVLLEVHPRLPRWEGLRGLLGLAAGARLSSGGGLP